MSKLPQLNEEQVEAIKKKLDLDKKISARYEVPEYIVESKFDPRLVKILLKYTNLISQ